MSMLDLLETIGCAKHGTRMLVADPFAAINASEGGTILLTVGTLLQIQTASGCIVSATADMGDRLQRVYIMAEQFHCLALQR